MQHLGKREGMCYPKWLWEQTFIISLLSNGKGFLKCAGMGRTSARWQRCWAGIPARSPGNCAGTLPRLTVATCPTAPRTGPSDGRGKPAGGLRLKEERIRTYVVAKLREGWSPEIIAGRIRLDHPGLTISHEAIYEYVYHPQTPNRKELILCLRRAHRRRKPRGLSRKERKTKIPNRIGIEMRPSSVDTRREFGHWEGDTLISRRSPACLSSLVERKSRLLQLTRLPRKGAKEVAQAIVARLSPYPPRARQTLTLDNGTENASHENISKATGLSCFFCHPYTSWERGTVENIQGLIRWYLPKGTDFDKITDDQVAWIESQLNHRPKKCLGFKTPLEVALPSVAFQG